MQRMSRQHRRKREICALVDHLRWQRRAAPDIVRIRHERVNRHPVGLAGDDDLVEAARLVAAGAGVSIVQFTSVSLNIV